MFDVFLALNIYKNMNDKSLKFQDYNKTFPSFLKKIPGLQQDLNLYSIKIYLSRCKICLKFSRLLEFRICLYQQDQTQSFIKQ